MILHAQFRDIRPGYLDGKISFGFKLACRVRVSLLGEYNTETELLKGMYLRTHDFRVGTLRESGSIFFGILIISSFAVIGTCKVAICSLRKEPAQGDGYDFLNSDLLDLAICSSAVSNTILTGSFVIIR